MRYYNPSTGRFVSEDPIESNLGEHNTYRSFFNNPFKFRDPKGEGPITQSFCSFILGGMAVKNGKRLDTNLKDFNSYINDKVGELENDISKYQNTATARGKYVCSSSKERDEKVDKLEKIISDLLDLKSRAKQDFNKLRDELIYKSTAGIFYESRKI